jgi:hypothetical protein
LQVMLQASVFERSALDARYCHVSPRYLSAYAHHAAWLENHRRDDNGTLAHRVISLSMAHPVSRQWKGYWQQAATRGIA